jgi:hypothetical protein
LWLTFFTQTLRHATSAPLLAVQAVAIAVGIGFVTFVALQRAVHLAYLFANLILIGALLVSQFSFIYWNRGSTANFSTPLSHLDAIYFTLGTLTTAGSGTVVAVSQAARGIQSVQMVLNLGYILFAVGAVVSRFASDRVAAK